MTGHSTGMGQTVLDGLVVKTTDAALLYQPDDADEIWIPRKVCLDGGRLDEGDTDVAIADWWLKQEGLL